MDYFWKMGCEAGTTSRLPLRGSRMTECAGGGGGGPVLSLPTVCPPASSGCGAMCLFPRQQANSEIWASRGKI